MDAAAMKQNAGFSLIEMLISVLLALFLLGGLISVVVLGSKTQNTHDSHARVQENARFAIELLLRDLRMTGYFGCAHDPAKIHDQLQNAAGTLLEVSAPLEGFDQDQSAWSPSGSTDKIEDIVAHSDAVTVRFANPSDQRSIAAAMTAADGGIPRPDGSDWRTGDVLVISDCDGADIFQVTSVNSDTLLANELSRAFSAAADLTSLWAARYFIAPSTSNGLPTLKRQILQGGGRTTTEELAQGVENLQFMFGEDPDRDGRPDVYRRAQEVTDWNRIVTVQVGLLLRSLAKHGIEKDTSVHQVLDHLFDDPDDLRVRRRVLHYTVALRNAKLGG